MDLARRKLEERWKEINHEPTNKTMKLIRYQIPQAPAWSAFDRLPSVRDLFEVFSDQGNGLTWNPVLDLHEDADKFTVTVELPGMKKEDFEIAFQDGQLRISGEKKTETESKEKTTYRSERFYGRFERVIDLPSEVDGSKVDAGYKDGILSITLPKAETSKPKKIDVKVE